MADRASTSIGLIADIHWTPSNADSVRSQLRTPISHLNGRVDCVIFLGDLVVEADTEAATVDRLAAVRDFYEQFDPPVFDLPGNHDLSNTTAQTFSRAGAEPPLLQVIELSDRIDGVLLDTVSQSESASAGRLGAEQLALLDDALAEATYGVVFSHHPLYSPEVAGGWFEDRPADALCRDGERALELFSRHENVLAAVHGHTHLSDTTLVDGVPHYTINAFTSESPADTSVNGSFADLRVTPESVERIRYVNGSVDDTETDRYP